MVCSSGHFASVSFPSEFGGGWKTENGSILHSPRKKGGADKTARQATGLDQAEKQEEQPP